MLFETEIETAIPVTAVEGAVTMTMDKTEIAIKTENVIEIGHTNV